MAPSKKFISQLGGVKQHGKDKWRIVVKIKGKLYRGPTRAFREDAEGDLWFARKSTSREQMSCFIQLLHHGKRRETERGYEKILSTISQLQSTVVVEAAKGKKARRTKRRARPRSKVKEVKAFKSNFDDEMNLVALRLKMKHGW